VTTQQALAIETLLAQGWHSLSTHTLERVCKHGSLVTALIQDTTITYIRNGHRVVRALKEV
jgi:hypothetical protein